MPHHLRIARPCSDLLKTTDMYCRGLGFTVLGRFDNHDGFDGVMLGEQDSGYHFEFTHCRTHPVQPTPTSEDLLVLYFASASEWQGRCDSMIAMGFKPVKSFNPYWDVGGRTFADHDGYRIVLQNAQWAKA